VTTGDSAQMIENSDKKQKIKTNQWGVSGCRAISQQYQELA